ncbi:MAG: hypothetical protein RDU20_18445 [Desulfomonilaceae bacterium]|nr:hypothetical protein [Desulfomonilaceae bacterium]
MAKSILYRLLGLGKIPKAYGEVLESEGVLLAEEGLGGSVVLRDFKAAGKRFKRHKSWFSGSVALTSKRVIAFAFSKQIINVPFDDPRFAKLACETPSDTRLCFSFRAEDFNTETAGMVEVGFTTPKARLFEEMLGAERHRVGRDRTDHPSK